MPEQRLSVPVDGIGLEGILLTDNKPSLIVVSHGYDGNMEGMMPLAEFLAEKHDVAVYGLRGHESDGIFVMQDAIQDHIELTRQLSQDYSSVGFFGFSTGATIAAYAAEQLPGKVKAQYLASPYLEAKDIRTVGWLVDLLRFINIGPASLGVPRLRDVKPTVPTRVAIPFDDNILKSSELDGTFRARFGSDNVVRFHGNHTFNYRDMTYLGKEGLGSINYGLFRDARDFFAKHLADSSPQTT